jgi:3,4-dihydroxy-2-butanone 4-phosphate synthase
MRRSTGGSILLGRLVALRVPLVIALLLVACSDQGAEPYDIDAAPVPGDFVDYYRSYSSEYMNEDRFGEIFDEVSLVEDEGRLVGPQFTLKIDKIVIADSHESFGSRRTFEASSGYELVVAQLADPRELAEYRPDFILESIDAVVEVDGGSRRLDRDISRGAGIIVVSVPVGSDPHLVIRHDGRRQVISLRTGTHHEVIEPFYDRTFWGQELNFRYSGFGRVVMGGIEFSGTATFDIYSLRLEYWHESIGYPSRGAWLILRSAPTNCNAPTRIGTGEGDLPLDPLTPMEPSDVFVLVDDEDRENEGDLIFAASRATPELMGFTIRYTSGVICVPMPGAELDRLKLPPMTSVNEDRKRTAFAVSVDARDGVTTGISAADRAHTVRVLADSATEAYELTRPGHVFPLRAMEGGVLRRPGHTEAAVALAELARR